MSWETNSNLVPQGPAKIGRPSHKNKCLISSVWAIFNVRNLHSSGELLQAYLGPSRPQNAALAYMDHADIA